MEIASSDDGTFTVTARLSHEKQECVKHLLTIAKDEIFKRTSRSRGVCLLGYKKTPFIPTPEGFVAKLGTVSSKRIGCRQFYAEGRYKYHSECYWQHPQSMASVTVVVTVADDDTFSVGPLGVALASCACASYPSWADLPL